MKRRQGEALAATALIRILCGTLRIRLDDRAGYFNPARRDRFIAAVWHNRIFVLPSTFQRYRTVQRLTLLTSASRDGELLCGIVQRFGLGVVRGSSSQRGAAALRELSASLEQGSDVIITPDGPRGPKYVLSPGVIYLAGRTGCRLMPIQVDYERFWELKSWDGFRVPKPFSHVTVTLHPSQECKGNDSDGIEGQRRRFEELLPGS